MSVQTQKPPSRMVAFYSSPVGKKILTGITGLGLTVFVLIHMIGNLSYFVGAETYNAYSDTLIGLGPALWVVEIGLLAFFVLHAVIGIRIYLGKRRARTEAYARYQSAGGPSRQTLSSRTMIFTGLVLLVFLVIHLLSFKYGPYYETMINGVPVRDLARLMREKFQHGYYAFGYVGVMLLLGFHLRHGFWSAFQSLGAMTPRLAPVVYAIGVILAILITAGFIVLPLWIYFNGGAV